MLQKQQGSINVTLRCVSMEEEEWCVSDSLYMCASPQIRRMAAANAARLVSAAQRVLDSIVVALVGLPTSFRIVCSQLAREAATKFGHRGSAGAKVRV